jgi:hypothetical protein
MSMLGSGGDAPLTPPPRMTTPVPPAPPSERGKTDGTGEPPPRVNSPLILVSGG